MRVFPLLALVLSISSMGCADTLPSKVPLHPEAANVEILIEAPNRGTYEPAGQVRVQIIGQDAASSTREALNALRNQASAKGASFVAVEEMSSRAAWDLTGRTIVTVLGTAYRPK